MNCILLVHPQDDVATRVKDICSSLGLNLELVHEAEITNAYWWFVRNVSRCCLVILDLNLGPQRAYAPTGVELCVALDHIARRRECQADLALLTAVHPSFIESFQAHPFQSLKLVTTIDKDRTPVTEIDQKLIELFRAAEGAAPAVVGSFRAENLTSAKRLPKVNDPDPETKKLLKQYSRLSGKGCFKELCEQVAACLLGSYSSVDVSALPPGESGCDVLTFTASRDEFYGEGNPTLVVKIVEEDLLGYRLQREADLYFEHCEKICSYVPLLIGPIHLAIQEVQFAVLAYEFFGSHPEAVLPSTRHIAAILKNTESPTWRLDAKNFTHQVFQIILEPWHHRPATQVCPEYYPPLLERRDLVNRLHEKMGVVDSDIARQIEDERVSFTVDEDEVNLRNPIHLLSGLASANALRRPKVLRTATIHGDLHSGNIVRLGQQGPWRLIDFAYVQSPGQVTLDFASLECDVKFRIMRLQEEKDALNLEAWLAADFGYQTARGSKLGRLSNRAKTIAEMVRAIREVAVIHGQDAVVEEYIDDYLIALIYQSLVFCELSKGRTAMHPWIAACINAEFLQQRIDRTLGKARGAKATNHR